MQHRLFTPRVSAWTGSLLILAIGVVHLLEISDGFATATYEGVLFIAMAAGAVVVAAALLRGLRGGWLVGSLLAGGAAVAYLASRTLGLPATEAEPLCTLGVISLAFEALFIAIAVGALRAAAGEQAGRLRIAA